VTGCHRTERLICFKISTEIGIELGNFWVMKYYERLKAFTAVTMKNVVFWDMALCRCCVNWRFGGTYRFHLQGRKIREQGTSVRRWLQTEPPVEKTQLYPPVGRHWLPRLQPPAPAASTFADFSTLKMKVISSSKTSDHTTSTHLYIPEDDILNEIVY
jgi:hypothetical protein